MEERFKGISLHYLLEMESKNELVLPNFQREFVWERKKQKSLVASFIVGIPIGGFLLLDGQGAEFAVRKLCIREGSSDAPNGECTYLLDGQQRLSTLKSVFFDFFSDHSAWEDTWSELYPQLQNRWFLKITPSYEEGGRDLFGWNDLRFDPAIIKKVDTETLLPQIEYRIIQKKDYNEWFNPGYPAAHLEGKGHNAVMNHIANKAAEEGLIPLYSLFTEHGSSLPLYTSVISKMATRRLKELQAEVRDGDISQVDILEHVEPSIREYEEQDNEEAIEEAWGQLKSLWQGELNNFVKGLLIQDIPRIQIDKQEINRAVTIFDSMNKGGTPLSTFDLIVARAALKAKTEDSLTVRINNQLREELEVPEALKAGQIGPPTLWSSDLMGTTNDKTPPISEVRKQYLNILSIVTHVLHNPEKSIDDVDIRHIKKEEQLELSSEEINDKTVDAVQALIRALCFLQMRCGIQTLNEVPYKLMLLPIAISFAHDDLWENEQSHDRVEFWYWASVFSGRYHTYPNARAVEDIKTILHWLNDEIYSPYNDLKNRALAEPGYSNEDVLLRTTFQDDETPRYDLPQALDVSIPHYILSKTPTDFLPEAEYGNLRLSAWGAAQNSTFTDSEGNEYRMKLERHHICPLASATRLDESTKELRDNQDHILNSPLNITFISQRANQIIRSLSVRDYISQLSELSLEGHSLPDVEDLERQNNENDKAYYERIMKRRFNRIRRSLRHELDELLA